MSVDQDRYVLQSQVAALRDLCYDLLSALESETANVATSTAMFRERFRDIMNETPPVPQ